MPTLSPVAPLGPAARRRRRRLRRWSSAGLVAAAGGVAVATLAPPSPPTVPVLLAARDLPVGAVLTASDTTVADRPATTLPDGVLAAGAVTGGVLASPLRRGEVLTDTRLAGGPLLVGQPPGTVATSVEVGDPALLDGLGAGVRVDVLARTEDPVTGAPTGADRIATDVVVLRVPSAAEAGFLGGAPAAGTSVLVAVDSPTAARLAAAAGRTVLTLRS